MTHRNATDTWGPIGVHPERQGRGVGIDEQRLPAYLETEVDRNVVLYEKFGFKVIAQAEINGVNNRFMWRPAHS